jgi:hypothetical protein
VAHTGLARTTTLLGVGVAGRGASACWTLSS